MSESKREMPVKRHMKTMERRKWERQKDWTHCRGGQQKVLQSQMLSPVAEARLSYLVSMEISISSASSRGPRGSRLQLTWLKHPSCCPTRIHVILHDPRKQRISGVGGWGRCQACVRMRKLLGASRCMQLPNNVYDLKEEEEERNEEERSQDKRVWYSKQFLKYIYYSKYKY